MKDKAQRVRRTPVAGRRNVLTATNTDPNFVYRFVNDRGERVSNLKEQGYEVVTDSNIRIGDRRVAVPQSEGSVRTASVGNGMQAVLMRIPKEYYEEDQAAKQAEVDEIENSMKQSPVDGSYGKVELGRRT